MLGVFSMTQKGYCSKVTNGRRKAGRVPGRLLNEKRLSEISTQMKERIREKERGEKRGVTKSEKD